MSSVHSISQNAIETPLDLECEFNIAIGKAKAITDLIETIHSDVNPADVQPGTIYNSISAVGDELRIMEAAFKKLLNQKDTR